LFQEIAMTRPMFPVVCVFLLPLVFLFASRDASAQDSPTEQSLYEYATTTKVSIDFKGGSVTEFVDQVKAQAEGLNVLIRSDVQNIQLPVLRLRNITAETALSSLVPLSLEAVSVELDQDSDEYFIIGPNYNREPDEVVVLNVAWYLRSDSGVSQEKMEKLLSAIQAGQQMLAASSVTMKISLHESTGLLFVKGSPDETQMVRQIVEELAIGQTDRHDGADHPSQPETNAAPNPVK
jgi:type II secretory pathway component GspD/PulD (secretin)